MNIYEKLLKIQMELKAPKGQTNKFGGYKYRSCEDISEALKPLCEKYKTCVTLSDRLVYIGDRHYIEATAVLYNTELDKNGHLETIGNTAYAREAESKKGMDESQITGTASSYARKYALNGLFSIDDTKDADTDEFVERTQGNKISKVQIEALYELVKNNDIDNELVIKCLQKYNYDKFTDIMIQDYKDIATEIENLKNFKS